MEGIEVEELGAEPEQFIHKDEASTFFDVTTFQQGIGQVSADFFSDPYTFLDLNLYSILSLSADARGRYRDLAKQFEMFNQSTVQQYKQQFDNLFQMMIHLSDGQFGDYFAPDANYLPQSIVGLSIAWETYKATLMAADPELQSLIQTTSEQEGGILKQQEQLAKAVFKLTDDALTEAKNTLTDAQYLDYSKANRTDISAGASSLQALNTAASTFQEMTYLWKQEVARNKGNFRDRERLLKAQHQASNQANEMRIKELQSKLQNTDTEARKLRLLMTEKNLQYNKILESEKQLQHRVSSLLNDIESLKNQPAAVQPFVPALIVQAPTTESTNAQIEQEKESIQKAEKEISVITYTSEAIQTELATDPDPMVVAELRANLDELQLQFDKNVKIIESKQSRILELEKLQSDEMEKVKDLEMKFGQQKEQIAEFELQRSKQQSSITQLKDQILKQEESQKTLSNQYNEASAQITELQSKLRARQGDIQQIERKLADVNKTNTENQGIIAQKNIEINKLKLEMSEAGTKLEAAQANLSLEASIQKTSATIEAANKVQEISSQIKDFKTQEADAFNATIKSLNETIGELRAKSLETEKLKSQSLADMQSSINELQSKLRIAIKEKEIATNESEKIAVRLDQLKQEQSAEAELKQKLSQSVQQQQSLTTQLNLVTIGKAANEQQLAVYVTENQKLSADIQGYQRQINELQIERQQVFLQFNESQQKLEAVAQIKEQALLSQREVSILNNQIQEFRQQAYQFEIQQSNSQQQIDNLQQRMAQSAQIEQQAQKLEMQSNQYYNELQSQIYTAESYKQQAEQGHQRQQQSDDLIRKMSVQLFEAQRDMGNAVAKLNALEFQQAMSSDLRQTDKEQVEALRQQTAQFRAEQEELQKSSYAAIQQAKESSAQMLKEQLDRARQLHTGELTSMRERQLSEIANMKQLRESVETQLQTSRSLLQDKEKTIMELRSQISQQSSQLLVLQSASDSLSLANQREVSQLRQQMQFSDQQYELQKAQVRQEADMELQRLNQELQLLQARYQQLDEISKDQKLSFTESLNQMKANYNKQDTIESVKTTIRLEFEQEKQLMQEEIRSTAQEVAKQKVAAESCLAQITELQSKLAYEQAVTSSMIPKTEHEQKMLLQQQAQLELQKQIVVLQKTVAELQVKPAEQIQYLRKFIASTMKISDLLLQQGATSAESWNFISDMFNIDASLRNVYKSRYDGLLQRITQDTNSEELSRLVHDMFIIMLSFMDNLQSTTISQQQYSLISQELQNAAKVYQDVQNRRRMETRIVEQMEFGTSAEVDEMSDMQTETEAVVDKRQELIARLKASTQVINLTTEKHETIGQMVTKLEQASTNTTDTFEQIVNQAAAKLMNQAIGEQKTKTQTAERALAEVSARMAEQTQLLDAMQQKLAVREAIKTIPLERPMTSTDARLLVQTLSKDAADAKPAVQTSPQSQSAASTDVTDLSKSIPAASNKPPPESLPPPDKQPDEHEKKLFQEEEEEEKEELEEDSEEDLEEGKDEEITAQPGGVDNMQNAIKFENEYAQRQKEAIDRIRQQQQDQIENFRENVLAGIGQVDVGDGEADLISILKAFRKKSRQNYIKYRPVWTDLQTIIEQSIGHSISVVHKWNKAARDKEISYMRSMYN